MTKVVMQDKDKTSFDMDRLLCYKPDCTHVKEDAETKMPICGAETVTIGDAGCTSYERRC